MYLKKINRFLLNFHLVEKTDKDWPILYEVKKKEFYFGKLEGQDQN